MSHRATVTELQTLAPQVVQITVAFADSGFHFQPGQWVNFRFPEGVSRAYTIASAPQRPQGVQLCVRVGPGKGGVAVQKLQAGAEVAIDGPFGDFLLPPPDGADNVAFLAGDTGIAPVRSIVLTMLATKDPRRAIVLYEPDRRHILYAGDFDPLARDGAIVHESGPIETLIARNRRRIGNAILMAAGFDPFLDRARTALEENGIDAGSLITESFGAQP